MNEGMRMATQGMMMNSVRQDIITNNLANAGTAGFRKESLVISSFSEIMDKEVGMNGMTQAGGELTDVKGKSAPGQLYKSSMTHFSQGALQESGNPFDLALDDNGKGFFTVQTEQGIEFTRAGSFRLNNDGFLVTPDGAQVLGHNGPIQAKGGEFNVADNGVITVDGRPVDKILVSIIESGTQRTGDTNFNATGAQVRASQDFSIKQGFVEQSNVNALTEMVSLMQVMRNFEANQKTLQAHDQKLQKVINEVGRVQ